MLCTFQMVTILCALYWILFLPQSTWHLPRSAAFNISSASCEVEQFRATWARAIHYSVLYPRSRHHPSNSPILVEREFSSHFIHATIATISSLMYFTARFQRFVRFYFGRCLYRKLFDSIIAQSFILFALLYTSFIKVFFMMLLMPMRTNGIFISFGWRLWLMYCSWNDECHSHRSFAPLNLFIFGRSWFALHSFPLCVLFSVAVVEGIAISAFTIVQLLASNP